MWGSSSSSRSVPNGAPWGPILALAGLAVVALSPSLFLGAVPAETNLIAQYDPWADPGRIPAGILGGDGFYVYLPDRLVAVKEWKQGRLPLWDPYVSGGIPLLGLQSANPLDPLIAFHLVLPPGRAAGLEYAILIFLAGLGMILYLRDRGVRAPPALALGGIAFALTPFFVYWFMTRVFLAGFALLPLALWAGERALTRPRDLRSGAVLALAVAYSAVAGTLQTLPLFLLVLGARLAWAAWGPGAPTGPRGSRGVVALAIAAGLIAGAIPLIAGVELYLHSIRTGEGGAYYAGKNFLHPRTVALWFSPGLFGSIRGNADQVNALLGRTFFGGSGWGSLGILPLGLAILGGLRSRAPKRDRIFWGGLALGVLAFLLLLGTPVHTLVVRIWPAFDNVDVFRFLFCSAPAGAVLAAWGTESLLETWARRERRWIRWAGLYAAAGVAVIVLGGWGIRTPEVCLAACLPLAAIVAAVLALGLIGTPGGSWRGWALAAIAALELGSLHATFNRFSPAGTVYPEVPTITAMRTFLDSPGHPRLMVPGHMRSLPTNTASVYGFSDVRGYTNTPIARYQKLIEWAEGKPLTNRLITYKIKHPIYRLLGGNLVYFRGRYMDHDAFPPLDEDRGLFRRRHPLPRAFLVHQALVAPDTTKLGEALDSPGFDPAEIAFLDPGSTLPPLAPARRPEFVDVSLYEPARIRIHARATAPGILVVADTFYPGWRATVDGIPARIFPVDWAVRGIALPPGEHRVELRYAPGWLLPGIAAAVLALAAMAAGLAVGPRGQDAVP